MDMVRPIFSRQALVSSYALVSRLDCPLGDVRYLKPETPQESLSYERKGEETGNNEATMERCVSF
jgi:hypothetical protein